MALLSHDEHIHNLDIAGRELLKTIPKTITTKSGAQRLQSNATGLLPWESTEFKTPKGDEIAIIATPARHGPSGTEEITGDVIGFCFRLGVRKTLKFI